MNAVSTAGRDGSVTEHPDGPELRRTARVTGLWYLALAVTGMVGFLVIRSQVYAAGDPAATLSNLMERAGLARLGVVVELGVVASQALVAVWFYKLLRRFNPTAAWAVAVFGMMNAAAIMASAAFMATAVAVAGEPALAVGGDTAATVQLLYSLSEASWGVGALFFGLWLIPMGYVAATSGRMPLWLGRVLVVGGAGYVVSAVASFGLADAPGWLVEGLVVPATIGELWMIGYLLTVGIRPRAVGVAEAVPAGHAG